MDLLLGLLLAIFTILIVLPVVFWGVYRWLSKRGKTRTAQITLALPLTYILVLGYLAYTALYPPDDFYQKEYQ